MVWDMLDRARETGAVTPAKLDPVYALLQAMQVSTAYSRACMRSQHEGALKQSEAVHSGQPACT